MTLKLPRVGLTLLALAFAFSIGLTLYLIPRLGGPQLSLSSSYTVEAVVPDAQLLEPAGVVLDRGIQIGTVVSINTDGNNARVTFAIDGQYAPLYRNAIARVGQRTVLGDAYLDIVRGTAASGRIPNGGVIKHVQPNIDFDQAFSTFTQAALGHTDSLLHTFGQGAASPLTAMRWGATVGQLSQLVTQTSSVLSALRDQQSELATLVTSADGAVRELGSRQQALTGLVDNGRRTLAVFAAQPTAVAAGLKQLPALLSTAQHALNDARPLLVEARPLVADITAAAPPLASAAKQLKPFSRSARTVISELPALQRSALPFLSAAQPVITEAQPFSRSLEPDLQNLAPIMQYLAPYAPDLNSWFTKTLGGGVQHDSKGNWIRFLIFIDPETAAGINRGAQYRNPYPLPGTQTNPQPYQPGSYPRLMPTMPGRGNP
jgi:phospholipid/cholesterol/gamma-HCH transport system substrate-binding protein